MQQSKKHRKKSTIYYDGMHDKEIPNVYTQEVNTLLQQGISGNWEKTKAKDRKMSTTKAYNTNNHKEKTPTAKQNSYSSVSDLVCEFL